MSQEYDNIASQLQDKNTKLNTQILKLARGTNIIDIGTDNVIVSMKLLNSRDTILSMEPHNVSLHINGFMIMGDDFYTPAIIDNFTSQLFPLIVTRDDIVNIRAYVNFEIEMKIVSAKCDIDIKDGLCKKFNTYSTSGGNCVEENQVIDVASFETHESINRNMPSFLTVKNQNKIIDTQITGGKYTVNSPGLSCLHVYNSYLQQVIVKNIDGKLVTQP